MTDLSKRIAALSPEKREALLQQLKQEKDANPAMETIPLLGRETNTFPLSFSQRRLWLLDQLEPGNPAYNLSVSIRLHGDLHVDALVDSIAEVIRRHEMLRTTFILVEDEPAQVIHAPFRLSVPVVTAPLEESELQNLIHEETSRSFDLLQGPLLRVKLLKLDDAEHIFIFTFHHIISDGWSVFVFIRELQALYQDFVNNRTSSLSDLPVQYVDFTHWQEEWLKSGVLESQLGYWKKQLAAPLPMLDLPTDYARPKVQTFNGASEIVMLSESISAALNELNRKEGCTMFMTLLAVFSVLLYRQTGQADVVVGSPIAGRSRTELEGLIGFFLNTLVMRINLDSSPTFRELVQRVREVSLQAYANQDVPFEKLLEELHPERHLSRTPVFQVFFNMLNFNNGSVDFADLKGEYVQTATEARFDLTLYVREENKRIILALVYNSDLFSQERMAEMGRQLELLVEQIVKAPDQSIQELSLLTPGSTQMLPDPRQPLEVQWFGSVHTRFTQEAIEHPDRLALIDTVNGWSYGDLETRTNQLAHYLIQNGVQRQDVVAIYARRSAPLVLALLGVLKAGAAFLILDPAYPAERLAKYVFLANIRGFINLELDPSLPGALETALQSTKVLPILCLHWDEMILGVLSEYSDQNPGLVIAPDDIAYVAFTSGSTGQPKGIVGTHRPLSHFFYWHTHNFRFHELDRFSMLSGLAHDPLLRDIFTPLWSGATLLIPDPEKMLAPGYLFSWIQDQQISVLHLTPAIEQLILNTTSDDRELRLDGLRYAFFGGETLNWQHVDVLKRIATTVTCVNFYGATETPQAMAYSVITTSDSGASFESHQVRETLPLGKGIDDVQLLVLTNSGRLAGIGEVGEIHIRTPYLSQGYLNDGSLTAQRFLTNPFTGNPTDRIYRTGDRGRYLPNGDVEFMGRNDDQVKIRGLRIELGEIESTLRNHAAVKQAVVTLRLAQGDDKRLVAYIVPDEVQFPNVHELKGYLQQYLPSYMIPAYYVLIDAVPLTPNGKVDRRALPEPDLQANRATAFLAPQTQLQELLAEIWTDVLKLEEIGIHDNFFELGGHSLLATQIMSRVRRVIQVELPLRVLFEFPTIASMATAIESMQKTTMLDIPPLTPRVHERPPRLSFSQERMWFIQQLAPESAAYHMPSGLRIQGELNVQVVEQTFNTIMERHAVLRTTFDILDGVPVQIIAPASNIQIPTHDLQFLPEAEQQVKVRQIIQATSKAPFDLVKGPLLRVVIIKLESRDHILFVCVHHIISDQWSGGVFTREFAAIYNALCMDAPIPLEPLPIQYADYGVWQRDWLQGEILQDKLAFWKKQLDGLSVLDLPTDYPRPSVVTFNGAVERRPLSASMIDAVRNLCRQEQVTPFMFFLGIFKILLLRYSGQQDVAVGSPITNRNWFETEALIGTFVNTVVLRTVLNGNPTFREFLHKVRTISLDAFNHQDLPFEKLVEELQPQRDLSHAPLIQVLFNMQNAPVNMPELHGDLKLIPLWPESRDAQFDINLSVTTDIVPNMVLIYNTDLFKRETILRILGHMETLMQGALEDPNRKVLDLEILTPTEREQLLMTWNDTQLEYPSCSVHQLVESQAERTPDAIAVQFMDRQLTYRELNERANQLAYYLRELGVHSETTVGIVMERSMDMIIGLLGILKAGGTYIPLDPMFPRDRLEYMLDFSETGILLTHEHPHAKTMSNLLQMENLKIVNLDRDWQDISRYPDENLHLLVDPTQLAYILFTSGSTGKPKGVQIPHRAVVNFLKSMQQVPGLLPNDRLLSVTTLSFDISVLEVFLPLITGACVVVLPGDAVYDGAALIQYLQSSNITAMQATPATWQMIIDAGWRGDPQLKVLCGGEAMPRDLARWLTGHVDSVWNMYGPTETTVWSTICEILPSTEIITIGRPIANTRIYILDANMESVPVNVAGDLYIAGDGVARGYLKLPELTAEKFVAEPFRADTGARMYKTGDQARYLADGRIDFLGRADFQVKVRGYRIELGEIETVLSDHPGVRQAVVIAREETPGDKRLVAYLIPESGDTIDTGELRQFIREKLPEYMIPSAFVFLDEFPMTPNRKVNRKALPALDASQLETRKDLTLPRTAVEAKIAEIWSSVLETSALGINDNFFDLGGHSLLATRVISRIRDQFHIDLPLREFFKTPTIAGIADAVDTLLWASQKQSTNQKRFVGNNDEIEI